MITIFAHAGEAHTSTNESLWHYLSVWYIAVLVFVIGLYIVSSLTYMLTKKSLGKTLLVTLGVLLLSGLFSYEQSPLLSVLSITAGFAIALGLSYLALVATPAKK